jgi:zinc transporter 1/2/3
MSIDGMSTTDKYIAAKTHEIVIDESVRYVAGESKDGGVLKSITFAVAMSLHSILEGFALGVQDDSTGILTLFISLIIHKGIEAFSVGLQITRQNSKKTCMVVSTILVYAIMTPVGAMLGLLLLQLEIDPVVKEGAVVVLEGLAGGTFIYVTFFEVLAQERANDHSNLVQLMAIFTGFAVIFGLQLKEHLGGGDSHGHHHG